MSEITRHPLCWPDNVPRTAPQNRQRALFENKTVNGAIRLVLAEVNRINKQAWNHADDKVIISTNLRLKRDGLPYSETGEPPDTGVAVFFQLRFERGGKWHERPIVLTCDKWTRVSWNLYAIAKDIEAQRARHRWGCTNIEQAFRGYMAIPERCGGLSWWAVLGIQPDATRQMVKEAYRLKATTEHPDKGGTTERWNRLQEAYEQAIGQLK